jgi:hypothetical protein
LQLLQVLLASYVSLHKDQFNKPLHADCIPHVIFCRESDVFLTVCQFSEAQNLVFCLFMNPLSWKWASSLNHRQPKVTAYILLHKL